MSHKPKKAKTATLSEAIGSGAKSNKHITKISASHHATPKTEHETEQKPTQKSLPVEKTEQNQVHKISTGKTSKKSDKKSDRKAQKAAKKAQKAADRATLPEENPNEKPLKEVFVLARPFVGFGRYVRDSWREIRQVRWPNRKATWKMTLAVLVYCAICMVFILLLDTLFTFIFNLLINK